LSQITNSALSSAVGARIENPYSQNNIGRLVMELLVHQQNLLFFREELTAKQSLVGRLLLLRPLAEEEVKNQQRLKEK